MSAIIDLLGSEADSLLNYKCTGIDQSLLHLPGPDYIDRVFTHTDRSVPTLRSLGWMLNSGRLAGTGFVSILPVDQGIEHTAGSSFAPNPIYFDPENIVKLAIEGGCNAVASTLGVLGGVSRKYAHKIPFMVKLNHNELLTYPNKYDQIMFADVKQAFDLGAVSVGATIYFGSEDSNRQIQEVAEAFHLAHELGMVTVLWCYLRNSGFKKDGVDYHLASDMTSQANHLGVTIEADIIKQKQAENRCGFSKINFAKTHKLVDEEAEQRQPDRHVPLPGGRLLHGPHGPDQLRRRCGRQRLRRCGQDGRHQQACRRHGPDFGPQGVPASDGGGRQAAQHHPGRLPG